MKMSENEISKFPTLTAEQLEKIGGGDCGTQWLEKVNQFTEAYEELVGFVSHVIERVAAP
jgi:hypothetical protein